MSLLGSYKGGNGLVDRLISSMPNLDEPLSYWRSAFDRSKARDEKLLIPERGIEEDFDQSSDRIEEIKQQLEDLLAEKKKEFNLQTSARRSISWRLPKVSRSPRPSAKCQRQRTSSDGTSLNYPNLCESFKKRKRHTRSSYVKLRRDSSRSSMLTMKPGCKPSKLFRSWIVLSA
ncbi:hypothetical protein LB505_003055 [Fusarium chuoi]|nr:hypothetical protein LB505_003055 [Fusarium chuoi]